VDRIVSGDVRHEELVDAAAEIGKSAPGLAGELVAEVGVDRQRVGFVDGDVVAHGRQPVSPHQRIVDVAHGGRHERGERSLRGGIEPGIAPQPGRMHKMVERHHRLQPVAAAGGQDVHVMVHRLGVERRRRPVGGGLCVARLHAAPLDPEAERIQSHRVAMGEIGCVVLPEIRRLSRSRHIAPRLRRSPVGLRLAGTVVAALGLIRRGRHTPQERKLRNRHDLI